MRSRLPRPSCLSTLAALLAALAAAAGCAPDESSVGAVLRTEPGLEAEYFDGTSFQRPSGVYQDASIDFEGWALNDTLVARGHAARTVSIRWTGQVRLARAETYTITFALRGRVRVWIEDALVIDDWVDGDGGLREPRGTVPAPGGGWRDLRVEWDQVAGPMDARLGFASASQPWAVVPASELRHLTAPAATGAEEAAEGDAADLPLQAVTAVAASPHGTVVAGVSSAPELFWDAWVIPAGGGPPRRLAPIGLALVGVDAAGALWTSITGVDAAENTTYETWLSPSDGSPAVPLSVELPAGFSAERAVADGLGGHLLVGPETIDGEAHLSVFAVGAGGAATRVALDPISGSPLVLDATLAAGALRLVVQSSCDGPETIVSVPVR
jgi:hypothetical protein